MNENEDATLEHRRQHGEDLTLKVADARTSDSASLKGDVDGDGNVNVAADTQATAQALFSMF